MYFISIFGPTSNIFIIADFSETHLQQNLNFRRKPIIQAYFIIWNNICEPFPVNKGTFNGKLHFLCNSIQCSFWSEISEIGLLLNYTMENKSECQVLRVCKILFQTEHENIQTRKHLIYTNYTLCFELGNSRKIFNDCW